MKRCRKCDFEAGDETRKCPACGHTRLYYAPSQEQIRNEAEAIQLEWSEGVRKSREVGGPGEFEYRVFVRAPARGRAPNKGLFSCGIDHSFVRQPGSRGPCKVKYRRKVS